VPLALAPSPVLLGVALLLAGAMLAPSLSLTFSLLSAVAPAGTETEAQTWSTTAIGGGVALGAAFGGFLLDHVGTGAALGVPPAVGLLAALVVGGRLATLRAADPPVPA
jgi:predicted MFS family arabinose efflux permease